MVPANEVSEDHGSMWDALLGGDVNSEGPVGGKAGAAWDPVCLVEAQTLPYG